MDVFYTPKALKSLDRKLEFIAGSGSRKLARDIAAAVVLGNEHDRLRGLDRYGRPQPAVKARKGRYKGSTGPPLAPSRSASRVVANFDAKVKGSKPPYRIVAGWRGVVSKQGVPFLPFLDQGIKAKGGAGGKGIVGRIFRRIKAKLSAGWRVPPRPIFGISPNTWTLIRKEIDDFKAKLKRVK